MKTAVSALLLALALAGSGFAGDRRELPSGCGRTIEAALDLARSAGNPETADICLALAIKRLAARVEALRIGKEAFGEIRAKAYLHGEGE